jgi:hypothetical protein
MIERATISEKILVLLLMIFSVSGFVWLALVPQAPPISHLLSRLGFVAALFVCLWLAMGCWTLCFVYMGRKYGWPLKPAILVFVLAGVVWTFSFLGTKAANAGGLIAVTGALIPILARRLKTL